MRNARQQAPAAPATRGPARWHCPWHFVLGDEPVGIELARRQRRAQQRRCAEADVAVAGKFQRALLGAIGHLDLFEPGRRVIGLDLRGDAPRRIVALTLLAGRSGERHRALEARRAGIEIQDAVEIDGERALARIDIEMHAGAVAVGALPRGDAKRIAHARQHEVAVAADRAGQRTHVAAEGDVVQFERAAARGIMQGDAAGEIEPIDRQRAQIDRPGRRRPVDPALCVEPEIERHAVDRQFGGAHLAAHQRAQAEFDVELVGADLAEIVGAADHDRAQLQRRRRQQPRVELAADANRRADDPRRLGLELRPELVPVDEIRPDERGNQCNDEGDRQAEQRRLHGVSP